MTWILDNNLVSIHVIPVTFSWICSQEVEKIIIYKIPDSTT